MRQPETHRLPVFFTCDGKTHRTTEKKKGDGAGDRWQVIDGARA
jgi:hypothetical protein